MNCEPQTVVYIVMTVVIIEIVLSGVLTMFIMAWPKKKRFEPNLIHLLDYERKLLYQREYGLPPIPVQPVPNFGKDWSEAEIQAMEYNRKEATEILGRIFPAS